ncbi:MAG: hypothetical protein V4581_01190 [Bacteroidota bacterium]
MANPKIVLAELDIDVKALLVAALLSKEALEKLKKELLALKDAGDTTSGQFRKMQDDMKQLTAIMNEQVKALKQQIKKNEDLADSQKEVTKAVKKTADAQEDLNEVYQEAAQAIDGITATAQDATAAMAGLSAEVEKNNSLMQADSAGQQVKTFNDYKDKTLEAAQSINIFNGGLGDFVSRGQQAGGVGNLFKTALGGMTAGIQGMGAAIKANPIGFLLTLIAPLIEQFKKFTPLTMAVEKAMAGLAPILDIVTMPIQLLAEGITFLINGFTNLLGSMSSAADEAIKLKEAEALLNTEMALQEERNNKAKQQIDDLIEKSQDQTLSEEERMQALQDAAKIETDNYNERKRLSEEAYRIAKAKLQQEKDLSEDDLKILEDGTAAQIAKLQETKGITADELKTLQDAKVEKQRIADEEGDILEHQAADRKALQEKIKAEKDAEAKKETDRRKKLSDDALTRQKQLLGLFVAESEVRGKSLTEQLKYEEDYANKSLSLLKKQLELKKITQIEYETDLLNIKKQMLERQASITKDFGDKAIEKEEAILNLQLQRSKSHLEGVEKIDQELVTNEKNRLDTDLKNQLEFLAKQKGNLDAAAIDKIIANKNNLDALEQHEIDYLTQSEALQEEHDTRIAENQKRLNDQNEAKKLKRKADDAAKVEADYQAGLQKSQEDFDAKIAVEEERYTATAVMLEGQLKDQLISQEEYDKAITDSEKLKVENIQKLEEDRHNAKMQLARQTYNQMAEIFGKESKAGKAFSAAAALIDTYQAANVALASAPPPFNYIAAAAVTATGLRNVAKITGAKEPKFEQGGLVQVGGNRHAAGGTLFTGSDGTRFEAEQGELIGVMNRNASRHFMAFNNAFPAGGSSAPNYFANGGIVSREIAQQPLNVDELAAKIALANSAIPAPVVAVRDIITQGNSYVQVQNGANF